MVSYHTLKTRAPKYLKERIEKVGIHDTFDYNGPILGDCGAFSYREEETPPYSPDLLLRFYDQCGFDIGATPDHLIWGRTKKDEEERQRRYDITLRNAQEMYREWSKKYQKNFDLMGVAQGWDPQSYADAVEKLYKIGFYYIGIGGLAGAQSEKITSILKRVATRIRSLGCNVSLHLFGVNPLRDGSSDLLSVFEHYGVASFDTAIMLRQAWRRVHNNYLLNSEGYTAIKVPMYLEDDNASQILHMLRGYADNKESLQEVLNNLRKISKGNINKWMRLYKKTLLKRPWEKCGCKICKKIGIDVVVFRGNERNMRRGFHNVYQFYHRFIEKEPSSLLDFSENE